MQEAARATQAPGAKLGGNRCCQEVLADPEAEQRAIKGHRRVLEMWGKSEEQSGKAPQTSLESVPARTRVSERARQGLYPDSEATRRKIASQQDAHGCRLPMKNQLGKGALTLERAGCPHLNQVIQRSVT